jgi:hypothetical protein
VIHTEIRIKDATDGLITWFNETGNRERDKGNSESEPGTVHDSEVQIKFYNGLDQFGSTIFLVLQDYFSDTIHDMNSIFIM